MVGPRQPHNPPVGGLIGRFAVADQGRQPGRVDRFGAQGAMQGYGFLPARHHRGRIVTGASAVGNHVEILFTDAAQTVTFGADLVNGELIPAVSSMPVAGAPTPAPIAVTVIGSSSTPPGTQPTLPAPAVAPTVTPTMPAAPPSSSSSYDDDNDDDTITTAVPATAPSASATTSPSGAGHEDDDEYEDHDDDDHDDEYDDHDDDHDDEGDDD